MMLFELGAAAPKNLGGRPRWSKVKEYQKLVEVRIGQGKAPGEIAAEIGISVPTLSYSFWRLPAWQARWGNRKRRTTNDHLA
jgi:hypothetical protein